MTFYLFSRAGYAITISGTSVFSAPAFPCPFSLHIEYRLWTVEAGPMLDDFSLRAKRVIFGTRVKAGRRGAEALDVGDLIVAIYFERRTGPHGPYSHAFPAPVIRCEALPLD